MTRNKKGQFKKRSKAKGIVIATAVIGTAGFLGTHQLNAEKALEAPQVYETVKKAVDNRSHGEKVVDNMKEKTRLAEIATKKYREDEKKIDNDLQALNDHIKREKARIDEYASSSLAQYNAAIDEENEAIDTFNFYREQR